MCVSHCDGQNSLFYRIKRDLKYVIPFENNLLKCHFKGLGWIAERKQNREILLKNYIFPEQNAVG